MCKRIKIATIHWPVRHYNCKPNLQIWPRKRRSKKLSCLRYHAVLNAHELLFAWAMLIHSTNFFTNCSYTLNKLFEENQNLNRSVLDLLRIVFEFLFENMFFLYSTIISTFIWIAKEISTKHYKRSFPSLEKLRKFIRKRIGKRKATILSGK